MEECKVSLGWNSHWRGDRVFIGVKIMYLKKVKYFCSGLVSFNFYINPSMRHMNSVFGASI